MLSVNLKYLIDYIHSFNYVFIENIHLILEECLITFKLKHHFGYYKVIWIHLLQPQYIW